MVEYSTKLVEQAVAERIVGDREEADYRAARERLEGIGEPTARGVERHRLDRAWFSRLGLDQPFALALADVALSRGRVPRVIIETAWNPNDEGAGLYIVPPQEASVEKPARSVLVLLRAERFLPGANLLPFLERELRRVSTMISAEEHRGNGQEATTARPPAPRSLSSNVVGRFLGRWR